MTKEADRKRAEEIARQVLDSVGGGDWKPRCYTAATISILAFAEEVRGEQREKDAAQVPTNWIDSLLSGPDAALKGKGGTWGCPDIERLLLGVKNRINEVENQ